MISSRPVSDPQRCSYCHDDLTSGDPLCVCGGTHLDCMKHHGSCVACPPPELAKARELGSPVPDALPPLPGEHCPWGMTFAEWEVYRARCLRVGVGRADYPLQPTHYCWCDTEPKRAPYHHPERGHRWRCGYESHSRTIRPGSCGQPITYLGWCSKTCRNGRWKPTQFRRFRRLAESYGTRVVGTARLDSPHAWGTIRVGAMILNAVVASLVVFMAISPERWWVLLLAAVGVFFYLNLLVKHVLSDLL